MHDELHSGHAVKLRSATGDMHGNLALFGELDGVLAEIDENLPHFCFVGDERGKPLLYPASEFNALFAGKWFDERVKRVKQLVSARRSISGDHAVSLERCISQN